MPLGDLDPDELTDELLAGDLGPAAARARRRHRAPVADQRRAARRDRRRPPGRLADQLGAGRRRVVRPGPPDGRHPAGRAARPAGRRRRAPSTRPPPCCPTSDIAAIGPLLQTITLPRLTRDEMRANKKVLAELRSALVAHLPEADVEPQQLVRFGARTVLTIVVPIVAIVFVITSINIDEITSALVARATGAGPSSRSLLGLRHAARRRPRVRRVLAGQAARSGARRSCRPPPRSSGSPPPPASARPP